VFVAAEIGAVEIDLALTLLGLSHAQVLQ